MQEAKVILSLLSQKSKQCPSFRFRRIYRYLFNPDFYQLVDDTVKSKMVDTLIQEMRREQVPSYGSPSHRCIQQIVSVILQSIYPNFIDYRDPHSALQTIRGSQQAQWVIQGRLPEWQTSRLIHQLKQRIEDGRFIRLVEQMVGSRSELLPELNSLCSQIVYRDWESAIQADSSNQYIRFQQDYLLFIDGTFAQARKWQEALIQSRCIDWRKKSILFLAYELVRAKPVRFLLPGGVIRATMRQWQHKGKARPIHRYLYRSVPDIIQKYQAAYQRMAHYYSLADNRRKRLRQYRYCLYSSLCQTIAKKESSSCYQVQKKYNIHPSILT